MLHVNNSLSGRVCCFFLASRLTIVSLDYSEKGKVINAVIQSVELNQLKDGFSCLQFNSLIKNHPEIMKNEVFMPAVTQVTANYIQDRFEPDFSPLGSINRHIEEAIMMCSIQYLQHVEGTLTAFIEV